MVAIQTELFARIAMGVPVLGVCLLGWVVVWLMLRDWRLYSDDLTYLVCLAIAGLGAGVATLLLAFTTGFLRLTP